MNTACGRLLAGVIAFAVAGAGSAQEQTTGSDAPPRPAIPFPATPTPKPKEEPMTQEQLDEHLVPKEFLGRTSEVLALVYNGFRRSQIDPCGCVTHQLGGLDKEARIVQRLEELNVPAIRVDAGGFVRDMPDERAITLSKHLLKGLGTIGYDAVNVSFTDLALSPAELKSAAQDADLSLVSANVTDQSGQLLFDPYIIKDVQLTDGSAMKVGILGITRPRVEVSGSSPAPVANPDAAQGAANAVIIADAAESVNKYLPELAEKADFVVVLHYDRRSNADRFLNSLSNNSMIDVLVMGENNQIQGSVQAIDNVQVVSGGYEGRQLGTLYVELDDEKKVASTWNKHIEVLQTIPPVAEITQVLEEAHSATTPAGAAETTDTAPGATPATPTKLDLGL